MRIIFFANSWSQFSLSSYPKVFVFCFLSHFKYSSFIYHEIVKASCGSAAGHTTLILLFSPPYHPVLIRQHDRSMLPFLREHFTLAALWYLLILAPSLLPLPLGSHSFSLTMARRPPPYISSHFPSPTPSTRQFTCQDGSCVCARAWVRDHCLARNAETLSITPLEWDLSVMAAESGIKIELERIDTCD